MTADKVFIPEIWETKVGESNDLSHVSAQIIRKLNIDGSNKMMGTLDLNSNSIKNVQEISSQKGDINRLEVDTIIAKGKCVVPDPEFSKQATPKSYVDSAISKLVRTNGEKVPKAVTTWGENGKLISSPISVSATGDISNIETLEFKTFKGNVGQLRGMTVNGGEIKLENNAKISGVALPLSESSAANKKYVDTTISLIERKLYMKDAFINSETMSTIKSDELFLPLKHVFGRNLTSKVHQNGNEIEILEDGFYRITVTANKITSNTNGVPNARAFLILNNTRAIASKPFGSKRLSFDLIAHEQLGRGALIGVKAALQGNEKDPVYLSFTATIERFDI